MGYTTNFRGRINLDKPLDDETYNFLVKLSKTRRMKRNLPPKYGIEGEYFVDGEGSFGQDNTPDVIDHNTPPSTQPGLWCGWVPTEDRKGIEWDGNEKFYSSDKWMDYIINRILKPKGYVGHGVIEAQGEDMGDHWWLHVRNNKVFIEEINEKLCKAEAYDILTCPEEDLPLYVGKELDTLAKYMLQKRLNGTISVQI